MLGYPRHAAKTASKLDCWTRVHEKNEKYQQEEGCTQNETHRKYAAEHDR